MILELLKFVIPFKRKKKTPKSVNIANFWVRVLDLNIFILFKPVPNSGIICQSGAARRKWKRISDSGRYANSCFYLYLLDKNRWKNELKNKW